MTFVRALGIPGIEDVTRRINNGRRTEDIGIRIGESLRISVAPGRVDRIKTIAIVKIAQENNALAIRLPGRGKGGVDTDVSYLCLKFKLCDTFSLWSDACEFYASVDTSFRGSQRSNKKIVNCARRNFTSDFLPRCHQWAWQIEIDSPNDVKRNTFLV